MAAPLKILFADDDLKYSLLLKRFLEKEGYDVTYTGNGTMALEQFPVVKPDLVLLDINMPGLNGFEVAEKIREADRHVLIFFLSDRSDKSDRLKGFSLKGNDYLAKPFYPEELLARIKERLETNPEVEVEEETYHFGNTVLLHERDTDRQQQDIDHFPPGGNPPYPGPQPECGDRPRNPPFHRMGKCLLCQFPCLECPNHLSP